MSCASTYKIYLPTYLPTYGFNRRRESFSPQFLELINKTAPWNLQWRNNILYWWLRNSHVKFINEHCPLPLLLGVEPWKSRECRTEIKMDRIQVHVLLQTFWIVKQLPSTFLYEGTLWHRVSSKVAKLRSSAAARIAQCFLLYPRPQNRQKCHSVRVDWHADA